MAAEDAQRRASRNGTASASPQVLDNDRFPPNWFDPDRYCERQVWGQGLALLSTHTNVRSGAILLKKSLSRIREEYSVADYFIYVRMILMGYAARTIISPN